MSEIRPRIGLVSVPDLENGSTIARYQARALDAHCGHVVRISAPNPWIQTPLNLLGRASHRLAPRHRFLEQHNHVFGKACGRIFTRELRASRVDWVYAPWGSAVVPYIETDAPLVYLSDATFRTLLDYYPYFSSLSKVSRKAGDELERLTIARADAACFTSEWAARSAIEDYGAPASKVHVIPMGANLDEIPAREELVFERNPGPVRLLFVGVDWERKGGNVALDTLAALQRMGIEATLTVVGCFPPPGVSHPGLELLGFLDKRVPGERARLDALFRRSDFFIMPTRAECAGAVYIEAAANALPSLGTRTGGVDSALHHGTTGLLFDLQSAGVEYARAIAELLEEPGRYAALRRSARDTFEEHFSWTAWGARMNRVTAGLGVAVRMQERAPADVITMI